VVWERYYPSEKDNKTRSSFRISIYLVGALPSLFRHLCSRLNHQFKPDRFSPNFGEGLGLFSGTAQLLPIPFDLASVEVVAELLRGSQTRLRARDFGAVARTRMKERSHVNLQFMVILQFNAI
jgi:hypothetical protein